jgi:hypothetical protein
VVRRENGGWRTPPDGLARGPDFEDAQILEVKAERPLVYVGALLGFYPREYEGERSWRWMGQTGALRMAATRESVGTLLRLELRAFPRDRRVEWFLAPGETTLTLACPEPAVVANDVLSNADSRRLGLAVGNWRMVLPPSTLLDRMRRAAVY